MNPEPKTKMINRAIKLLRSYHNLKQKEMASRLGVSQSHLSELEGGTKSVSYDLLERYSEVFKIPVSAIAFFGELDRAEKEGRDSFPVKLTGKALKILEWLDSIKSFEDDDASHAKPAKAT
jgi:transcriptional regulator with XRE-family HTH domain